GNGTLDFDLRTITRGFQEVKPSCTVSAAENGSVELQKDGYTARFTPDKNFKGLASFKYTVKGNDNTEYSGRVEVLVEKSASAIDPPQDSSETAQDSTTAIQDAFRDARAIRNAPQTHKNSFHDLKGRRFEKQIPYRVLF
ncbi:MAG: cadherin-like domain-containing protein, partial [Aeriscardovia sp.]|nr:cadherin-like domain-containing protein [Aeriscardovia sp.]